MNPESAVFDQSLSKRTNGNPRPGLTSSWPVAARSIFREHLASLTGMLACWADSSDLPWQEALGGRTHELRAVTAERWREFAPTIKRVIIEFISTLPHFALIFLKKLPCFSLISHNKIKPSYVSGKW